MKKFYLTILLINSFLGSIAQEFLPFPDSAATWTNSYSTIAEYEDGWGYYFEFERSVSYCTNGADTLIGGQNYTRIDSCFGGYKGAFRSDEGKVYYVPTDSTSEFLLYDFSVSEGDTIYDVYAEDFYGDVGWWGPIIDYLIVESVSTIEVDGITRKKISVGDGQWIEGIGNTKGLFLETWENISGYSVSLECMSHEDTIRFQSHDVVNIPGNCTLDLSVDPKFQDVQVNIYPNPTSDKMTCQFSAALNIESILLTDISGNIVYLPINNEGVSIELDLSAIPAGIYTISFYLEEGIYHQRVIKN